MPDAAAEGDRGIGRRRPGGVQRIRGAAAGKWQSRYILCSVSPAPANPPNSPRGKRSLCPGRRCVRKLVSVRPDDWAYWRDRAARLKAAGSPHASVSGVLRAITAESRRLRHDLGGPVHRLELLADLMGGGGMGLEEAVGYVRRAAAEMGALIHATDPPAVPK